MAASHVVKGSKVYVNIPLCLEVEYIKGQTKLKDETTETETVYKVNS